MNRTRCAPSPPPATGPAPNPGTPPGLSLSLRNHQRTRRLPTRALRQALLHLLRHELALTHASLAIRFVADAEMTRLNNQFLQHAGSTDVISFSYAEPGSSHTLHGDLAICVNEALRQARRFHTTWQDEILRYAIHGILHLLGHDDLKPAARRHMKRIENQLLRRTRPLLATQPTPPRPRTPRHHG